MTKTVELWNYPYPGARAFFIIEEPTPLSIIIINRTSSENK